MQVKFPEGMSENDINDTNFHRVSISSNNHI